MKTSSSKGLKVKTLVNGRGIDYTTIPVKRMTDEIKRYMEYGEEPSSEFLRALLSNDLKRTFRNADEDNYTRIHDWINWLTWNVPACAWGSKDDYEFWVRKKQMENES